MFAQGVGELCNTLIVLLHRLLTIAGMLSRRVGADDTHDDDKFGKIN